MQNYKLRAPSGKNIFTLVELLVVIAIISILAGMLLPALEHARDEAIKVSCMNNLKNFGAMAEIYRNDYDGYYWPSDSYQAGSMSPYFSRMSLGIKTELEEYGMTKELAFCPDISDNFSADTYYDRTGSGWNQPHLGYAYYAGISAHTSTPTRPTWWSPSRANQRLDLVVMSDITRSNYGNPWVGGHEPDEYIGGINQLYADGSAGWAWRVNTNLRISSGGITWFWELEY